MSSLLVAQILIMFFLGLCLGDEHLLRRRTEVRWLICVGDAGVEDTRGRLVPEGVDEEVAAIKKRAKVVDVGRGGFG